jgi:hypothetical protein
LNPTLRERLQGKEDDAASRGLRGVTIAPPEEPLGRRWEKGWKEGPAEENRVQNSFSALQSAFSLAQLAMAQSVGSLYGSLDRAALGVGGTSSAKDSHG